MTRASNNNFFITLMSNSSASDFPDNKTSDFTVNLAKNITLEGDWEVALAELIYPQTIQNISRGNDTVIIKFQFSLIDEKYTSERRITIKPGYYNSVTELVDAVNDQFRKEIGVDLLEFNDETEKVFVKEQVTIPLVEYPKLDDECCYKVNEAGVISIETKDLYGSLSDDLRSSAAGGHGWSLENIPQDRDLSSYGIVKTSILLDNFLALQLGFEPGCDLMANTKASTYPKLDFGIPPELLVYCDIVDHQLFGDAYAQVLRITNTVDKGEIYGSTCVRSFNNRNYIPIITKHFKAVQISLRSTTGAFIPFNFGTSNVLLHFRKI